MKNSNRINKFIFSLVIVGSILYPSVYAIASTDAKSGENIEISSSAANQETNKNTDQNSTPLSSDSISDTEIDQADKSEILDAYETVLKMTLSLIDSVDSKLEELGSVVGLGKLKTKNKKEVSQAIREMRELTFNMRKQLLSSADPANITVILHVTRALAQHLNDALEKKFYELAPFDPAPFAQTRSMSVEELSPEKVAQHVEKVKLVVDELEQRAKTAGLHWYNKVFRKVDDTVSAIWKHKIGGALPVGLTVTLGTLAAATAFYWFKYCQLPVNPYEHIDPRKLTEDQLAIIAANKQAAGTLHVPGIGDWEFSKYTGKPLMTASEKIVNSEDAGWLSSTEHWMSNAVRHPLGAMLTAATVGYVYYEWDEIKKWYHKQAAAVYNFLRGGASNFKFEEEDKIEPRYTFKDAIGLEDIKKQLSIFVRYLEDPEHFDRSNLQPEKGILFTGDTRTGKSFMAECLAGEIKEMLKRNKRTEEIGFHVISANLINKRGIAYLLELAKREAPCILFIDEIDLLRLQRDRDSTLLSEFLSTMSGCFDGNTRKMVIIIGATNKPSNIDSALLQHGRFSTQIPFTYPSFDDRKRAIEKKLDALAINPENFNLNQIARELEGASFKDIDVMLTKAFQDARSRGEVLSQEVLDQALDSAIRRVIETDLNMPLDEQFLVAAHQAGHALAHRLIDSHEKLSKVTLKQYIPKLREEMVHDKYYYQSQKLVECGKVFTYHLDDRTNLDTQEEKINQVKILLAGNVAEKILFGSTSFSYHPDDKEKAFNIIKSIVYQGMRPETLSKAMNSKKLDECHAWLEKVEAEVTELFKKHEDDLKVIASALQHVKTLTNEDIDMVLEFRRQELAGTLPKEIMEMKEKAEKEMRARMEEELRQREASGRVPAAPREVLAKPTVA